MKKLMAVWVFFLVMVGLLVWSPEKALAYPACSNENLTVPCTSANNGDMDSVIGTGDTWGGTWYIFYKSDPISVYITDSQDYSGFKKVAANGDSYLNTEWWYLCYGYWTNMGYFWSFVYVDTTNESYLWSYHVGLTISLSPEIGGGVASLPEGDGIYCGIDSYTICQMDFTLNSEVELEAYPNSGYAFAYWDDGTTNLYDNPLTVTADSTKTLTAKFFKVFRASVGNFRANINDDGGQCVPYVRYETDIPWDDFNGNAASTYQQAISAGYATSATVPRISSVIVFAVQSGMSYGHVGIVTAINGSNITIRDSNWGLDELVSEHTVNVSNYDILGYIYYTP